METLKAINSRASARNFKKKEVKPELVAEILEAGNRAPSSHNSQPWHFLLIRNQETKDTIAEAGARALHERKKKPLKGYMDHFKKIAKAPVFIAVACDKKESKEFYREDGSAATQNMLLAAHDLGLGGVWVGAPLSTKKYADQLKKDLKVPARYEFVSIIAIGHPSKAPKPTEREDLKKKIHMETW